MATSADLIQLNLNRSESPAPPDVPRNRTESDRRVQFSGEFADEEEAPPPSYDVVEEQDRTNTLGVFLSLALTRANVHAL